MLWSQAFPFVALLFYEEDNKDFIMQFLGFCFFAWLVLNLIFFSKVNHSYLNTFFGTKTAPQYTCELYETSKDDSQRFDAVFSNRIQYTSAVHDDVKAWIDLNVEEWKENSPSWFNIEIIPDEFLRRDVFEAEGGKQRRRSSVRILISSSNSNIKNNKVKPVE